MKIIVDSTNTIFSVGEKVPFSGRYVCVPCGYTQYFEKGDMFTICEVCLAGTPDGPTGYESADSEFWEYVE